MYLFDARALQGSQPTGVGHYTKHIAKALQQTDIAQKLSFLTTGIKKETTARIPNKAINLGILLADSPTLEQLSHTKPKAIFIPNLNFVATQPDTPYILTIHDLSFHHHKEWYSKKVRMWHTALDPKKLICEASHVIAVSNATKNDCIKTFGITENKISTIYPGIKKQTPSTEPALVKKPYILSIGAIEPRKNLEVLFRAFKNLKKKHTNLQLVIVGPLGFRGKEIIKKISHDDVIYLGYVTHKTKQNLLTHAKVFAYPSLFEGFGFPALEAMMMKTPVVASWTTSLKEILGSHTLLTNPYNHDELALAINSLLTDTILRNKLAESAHNHAQTFTWSRCANQTAQILKDTANKTQSSPLNPHL